MNLYSFGPHARHFIELTCAGEFEQARELLGKHPEIAADRNTSRETALHWLAIESQPEDVQLLLQAGADANTISDCGNSVLHDFAALGLVDIARMLIQADARVDARQPHNMETPLHAAARQTPEPSMIDVLIDAGADVEARTHLAETPLHEATALDNRGAAERLLARGANANVQDDCGYRPIDRLPVQARAAWQTLFPILGTPRREEV